VTLSTQNNACGPRVAAHSFPSCTLYGVMHHTGNKGTQHSLAAKQPALAATLRREHSLICTAHECYCLPRHGGVRGLACLQKVEDL